MISIEEIKKEVINNHDYVVSLRRYFHMHPELSKKEYNTALKIEEELDKLNIYHKRVDETGVYAVIKGKNSGKTVLLRADIDALPILEKSDVSYKSLNDGVMHACGHDGHIATLLGAAKILSNHLDDIYGTIILNFQQAEEIGYGARQFIDRGLVNNVDRCFGIHVASNLESGKIAIVKGPNNASVDWFKMNVYGKSTHVSQPEKGIDALYIASLIVVSLQSIASRLNSPMDNVLVGIGKMTSGTSYNIVASEAELEGTVRCLTKEIRKNTKESIERIANNIAAMYNASVKFEWKDFTSPLINDNEACDECITIANEIFGANNVVKDRKPSLTGDDMAEYINVCKGAYLYLGTRNPKKPNTLSAQHNEYFDIDEDALINSVSMYSLYALEYLYNNK